MKRQIKILMTGAALVLTFGVTANAANIDQVLLPGAMIPQFVEPLPLLEFEFINATNMTLPGLLAPLGAGLNETTFPVNAEEFRSQILPSLANWPTAPATCLGDTASSAWGYRTGSAVGIDTSGIHTTYLGPVVIAERGVAANPTYGNNLPVVGVVQANLPIDWTLDWADSAGTTGPIGCLPDPITHDYTNPLCADPWTGEIPIATHLHGGEVLAAYDGGPDAWFTQSGVTGPGYPGAEYHYPNEQQEGTIWFHDHALGITRLNVYAGLAGIMPIIDPANPPLTTLPQLTDGYDIPLIIQDRSFDTNCEIFYNLASNPQPNPTVHPFWIPEFIGDTIVVNGKTWPYLDVEPRQYRFRFVNGSNARFYDLSLSNGVKFFVIATDDGYLQNAVKTGNLIIGPGERYEVIVDFKTVKGGKPGTDPVVNMFNAARTPFPGGGAVIAGLTDTVMQFRVKLPLSTVADTTVAKGTAIRPAATPIEPILNAHDPATGSITRQLTLNEVIGAGGPLELVVNNSKFNLAGVLPGCTTPLCRETELPAVGDTEIWEIINITADAHPMHLHLTSFQVLDRTPFKAAPWMNQYDALLMGNGVPDGGGPPNQYNIKNADGAIGGNPAIGRFLKMKDRRPPLPYEMGWKDTVITYPGEVTRIVVRWDTTDTPVAVVPADAVGTSNYPFDPTVLTGGVGYVWHCHIIDHEDNEMMRNYVVGVERQPIE